MYRNILVPTDGSDITRSAVSTLGETGARGSEVGVLFLRSLECQIEWHFLQSRIISRGLE